MGIVCQTLFWTEPQLDEKSKFFKSLADKIVAGLKSVELRPRLGGHNLMDFNTGVMQTQVINIAMEHTHKSLKLDFRHLRGLSSAGSMNSPVHLFTRTDLSIRTEQVLIRLFSLMQQDELGSNFKVLEKRMTYKTVPKSSDDVLCMLDLYNSSFSDCNENFEEIKSKIFEKETCSTELANSIKYGISRVNEYLMH